MVIEDMVMVIISFLCQEGCGADDAHYYPFTVPNCICIDEERDLGSMVIYKKSSW